MRTPATAAALWLRRSVVLATLALLAACASPAASGPTTRATATTLPTATARATATPMAAPGAISGDQLMYPADSMPALAIYAISVTNSHVFFSTQTTQGQFSYTISGVTPGMYDVVAYLANGTSGNWKVLAGGYTQFVVCGLAATCTDHTLIAVTVLPGQTVRHIDPNDFYGGTYPPRPNA
jgi:hypothetical protein